MKLRRGRPHQCFTNAIKHVLTTPGLLYVEGYICGCAMLHHAWVVETVTGTRHEVTLTKLDNERMFYEGIAFTCDELRKRLYESSGAAPILTRDELDDCYERMSLRFIEAATGFDDERLRRQAILDQWRLDGGYFEIQDQKDWAKRRAARKKLVNE